MSATVVAPKTVLDVLREARELYASSPSHAPRPEDPPKGTYCAITACLRASVQLRKSIFAGCAAADSLEDAAGVGVGQLADWIGVGQLADWNAEHTTEEVLEAWDRAIAALEAEVA